MRNMEPHKRVIILSAENSKLSYKENEQRTRVLQTILEENHLVHQWALGNYKGTTETSFIVLPRDNDEVTLLRNVAFMTFEQEIILFQASNGQSLLVGNDGSVSILGQLVPVSRAEAVKHDNYTIFNKVYWITK